MSRIGFKIVPTADVIHGGVVRMASAHVKRADVETVTTGRHHVLVAKRGGEKHLNRPTVRVDPLCGIAVVLGCGVVSELVTELNVGTDPKKMELPNAPRLTVETSLFNRLDYVFG